MTEHGIDSRWPLGHSWRGVHLTSIVRTVLGLAAVGAVGLGCRGTGGGTDSPDSAAVHGAASLQPPRAWSQRRCRLGSNSNRLFVRFLRPMWTRLTCGVTLDNDHGIRITLKSMTIDGPAGLTLP